MHFVYWQQTPWAPVWRGGRLPRKLKKRFHHHGLYWEPAAFRRGYTYPGHPEYKPITITSDVVGTLTDVCWVDTHVGKRVGGRWKPRHIWSEIRRG